MSKSDALYRQKGLINKRCLRDTVNVNLYIALMNLFSISKSIDNL